MKTRYAMYFALACLLMLPCARAAAAAPLNTDVQAAITAMGLTKAHHGIHAVSAKTGRVLIDIDSLKPLNPASNVKMVTAAVALRELGGDHRFTTALSSDRRERGGLVGNLYIKGTGDPFFVTEVMEEAVKELIRKGVRRVAGDIVVDQSYFRGGKETSWADSQRPYATSTAAASLNFNCVRVIVTRRGASYDIALDAPSDYVTIVNRLKPSGKGIYVKRDAGKRGDTITLTGGLPQSQQRFEQYVNISHPSLYLGAAFKTALAAKGVPVDGSVREGKAAGEIIFEMRSKPLRDIVDDMNRFSNNFVAEQLVYHMGAAKYGPPGSMEKGMKLMREYLISLGIPSSRFTLVNGSGLSRDNLMTARDLVAVLKDAYDDRGIRKDYVDSLSIAGVKGTIKGRHKGPLLRGKLYGKTGSLSGVSTLTGFIPMASGELAIFAVLTNGTANLQTCHKLQDTVATLLAKH